MVSREKLKNTKNKMGTVHVNLNRRETFKTSETIEMRREFK